MNTLLAMRRISDRLDRIVILVCVVIVAVMLLISILGIALEATFNLFELGGAAESFVDSPLGWLYSQTRPSMTRLFLPWVAMLSMTVGFKRGEHVAIAMAIQHLPPAILRPLQWVNLAVVGLFGVALAYYGYGFFQNSTQFFMVSDTLQVSHKWTALSVPVAGLVMCVHLLSGTSLVRIAELEVDEAEVQP